MSITLEILQDRVKESEDQLRDLDGVKNEDRQLLDKLSYGLGNLVESYRKTAGPIIEWLAVLEAD